MKIAFIVTSAIHVNRTNRIGTNLERPRTVHSTEERERHTFFTLGTLFATYPDADIFLVDGSSDYTFPKHKVNWANLHIHHTHTTSPNLQKIISTHPHKSYCEGLLLLEFIESNKQKLLEYDIIFKVSGRYLPYFKDQTTLDPTKIYFKKPLAYEWNEKWNYHLIDLRKETNDNKMRQYSSVLYGFGQQHFHKFKDILHTIVDMTGKEKYSHYDMEALLYYFTRPFQNDIIETDWMVSGFVGSTQDFYWY